MSVNRSCTAAFDAGSSQGLSYAGYHLIALAGRTSQSPSVIQFADATATASSHALYAINGIAGTGAEIGAPGEWLPLDFPNTGLMFARSSIGANKFESAFDPATGVIRDYRVRFTTFARGNRLYRVDHVATAGTPVPVPWGSVTTEEICRSRLLSASTTDIADIAGYWVFKSPGADGRCNSGDDVFRALSFAAGAIDPAVNLSGEPIASLHDAARRVTGYILRNGAGVVRVNADFTAPTPFLTLPAFTSVRSSLGVFGDGEPRFWLFTTSAPIRVYAYDLVAGGAPIELFTLATGENAGPTDLTTEAGTAYLRMTDLGRGTIRVLRINADLSTQVLGAVTPGALISPFESATPIRTTTARVILAAGGGLYSLPKSGGVPTLISSPTAPLLATAFGSFGFITAGNNVWYPSSLSLVLTSKLAVVADDGSNPAIIDVTLPANAIDFLRPLLPSACSQACRHAYLTLNTGAMSVIGTNVGSEVATYDGATRLAIATHGQLPATPLAAVGTLVSMPAQLGQNGLLHFYSSDESFALFLFATDQVGLRPVTLN
jgi:hypothetical protein